MDSNERERVFTEKISKDSVLKVGDIVIIKSKSFFKDLSTKEDMKEKNSGFIEGMYPYCDEKAVITDIIKSSVNKGTSTCYDVYTLLFLDIINEDDWSWNEWMFEREVS